MIDFLGSRNSQRADSFDRRVSWNSTVGGNRLYMPETDQTESPSMGNTLTNEAENGRKWFEDSE